MTKINENMEQNSIKFLESRGYRVERCIDDEERYRLMRGEEIIADDSAYEDFYGDKETVAEEFVQYVKNEVLPEEQKIEADLSAYDNGMRYTIIQAVRLSNDAKLMTFVSDNGIAKSSAVVYNDGTIFITDDWQADYAENAEQIDTYDWYTLDGRKAVILDRLPRIL